mgnify:CR=1 FL=1
MKNRKNKKKISKVEKFLYKTFTFLSICLVIGTVVSQVSLSEINLEVEKLKIKLEEQENVNEALAMKINEMASLDNVNATSMGLAYNNENIKNITE